MQDKQEDPTMLCDGCGQVLDWNGESRPVLLLEGGNHYRFHKYECAARWAMIQEQKCTSPDTNATKE